MTLQKNTASHNVIFGLLVVLMFCAVGASLLHLPALTNNLIIFAIAFTMAGLVLGQYMGLRLEGPIVKWVVIIPTILFAILVFLLMPDIAHVHIEFLRFH